VYKRQVDGCGGDGFGFIGENSGGGGPVGVPRPGPGGEDQDMGGPLNNDTPPTSDPCARIECPEMEVCRRVQDTAVCACAPGTTRLGDACAVTTRTATLVADTNLEPASSDPEFAAFAGDRVLTFMQDAERGWALWALMASGDKELVDAPRGSVARDASSRFLQPLGIASWLYFFSKRRTSRTSSFGITDGTSPGSRPLAQSSFAWAYGPGWHRAGDELAFWDDDGRVTRTLAADDFDGVTDLTETRVLGKTGDTTVLTTFNEGRGTIWRITGDQRPVLLGDGCWSGGALSAGLTDGFVALIRACGGGDLSVWVFDAGTNRFEPIDEPMLRDQPFISVIGERHGRAWLRRSSSRNGEEAEVWTITGELGDAERLTVDDSVLSSSLSRDQSSAWTYHSTSAGFVRTNGVAAETTVFSPLEDMSTVVESWPFGDGLLVAHLVDTPDGPRSDLSWIASSVAEPVTWQEEFRGLVVARTGQLVLLREKEGDVVVRESPDAPFEPVELGDVDLARIIASFRRSSSPTSQTIAPDGTTVIDFTGDYLDVAHRRFHTPSAPNVFVFTEDHVFSLEGPTLVATERASGQTTDLLTMNALLDTWSFFATPERLWFAVDDGEHGREPWTSDGTVAGTRLVTDHAKHTADGGDPLYPVGRGGFLVTEEGGISFFGAEGLEPLTTCSGTNIQVTRDRAAAVITRLECVEDDFLAVRVTDGTLEGTQRVGADLCRGGSFSELEDGRVMMHAGSCEDPALKRLILFDPRRPEDEPVVLADSASSRYDTMSGLLELGDGRIAFTDASAGATELWLTDGTPEGTRALVSWRCEAGAGAFLRGALDERVVLVTSGTRCTGPPFGKVMFVDTSEDFSGEAERRVEVVAEHETNVSSARMLPGAIVYQTNNAVRSILEDGTTRFFENFPAYINAALVGDTLVGFEQFTRASEETSVVLFDGAELIRVEVDAPSFGNAFSIFALNDRRAIIAVYEERGDAVLLLVDVDEASVEVFAAPYVTGLTHISQVGPRLFFAHRDEAHGIEPWSTDGTLEGTSMVLDALPGPESSDPTFISRDGRLAYFAATTPEAGEEPWVSDGTPEGTFMLADVWPGPTSSRPDSLTIAQDLIYLWAHHPDAGRELWVLE